MSEVKDQLKSRKVSLGFVVVFVCLALVLGFLIGSGVN